MRSGVIGSKARRIGQLPTLLERKTRSTRWSGGASACTAPEPDRRGSLPSGIAAVMNGAASGDPFTRGEEAPARICAGFGSPDARPPGCSPRHGASPEQSPGRRTRARAGRRARRCPRPYNRIPCPTATRCASDSNCCATARNAVAPSEVLATLARRRQAADCCISCSAASSRCTCVGNKRLKLIQFSLVSGSTASLSRAWLTTIDQARDDGLLTRTAGQT